MGLGGGTCPVLGYEVTQARSRVIAPLARAAPGGPRRAPWRGWHRGCVRTLPCGGRAGAVCARFLPGGSARGRSRDIFSHVISVSKGSCGAGKHKGSAWLPEPLAFTYLCTGG